MAQECLKESETVELKKSTSELKESIISVVAILNKHSRGELYFGVKNDGSIVGQDITERTLREVSKAISDNVEPKIYPKISNASMADKTVIKVEFKGLEKPYFAYGRAYIRVSDEDKQLSAKELERLIIYKNKDKLRWDNQVSEYSLLEVNTKLLKSYISKAKAVGRLNFSYTNVALTLKKLELMSGNQIVKAVEVLFCNKNQLEVQTAIFAGTDKLTFLDIKLFKGNVFELLEKSEAYIQEHMRWRVKFGKLEREEIPEVPVDALREALVNSLCHRDYYAPEANQIAIFKDRIEIYNPGTFPESNKPEDFFNGEEKSILRNPLIAQTLYYSKDIEKWGSGIKRIHEDCTKNNVNVEFKNFKRGFSVIFYRKSEETARLVEGLVEGLAENQKKILELITKNSYISKKELAEKIGISTTAIDKNITRLKKKGLLDRVGPDKGGHWKIKI
ncbi:putative DNA binding domain-containing protein [archaeon]|nr:putative DNA binding domain-containing protein [archaeon]